MAQVIRMPLLSDTMTEGKIVAWNKKVGDFVKSDDVIAEVETDKATMEVVGYEEGVLLHVGVPAGQAAQINQIIAIVGKAGEDFSNLLEGAPVAATAAPTQEATVTATAATSAPATQKVGLPDGAKEIRMPLLSDTMSEGKIVAWNKKIGDHVKSDDVIAEVETDKATMEVVGYEEGTLLYIGVEAGSAAKINQIIAIVGKPGTDVAAYVAAENSGANATVQAAAAPTTPTPVAADITAVAPVAIAPVAAAPVAPENNGRIKASPLAKKIAADKGIDLHLLAGTGDGGRVTKRDIESYTPATTVAITTMPAAAAAPAAVVQNFVAGTEGHTDVSLTQMRKTVARRLSESKFSAPHFYLTMEINMDNAMASRTAINAVSPVKVSFNDMIIKAAAMALRKHPDVNSSWMGDFIRHNQHIHIGSAVALPDGLIVPVIKFADAKSLSQIAADANELYKKAKDKKLQPAEFSGNTFTISNLGMMGIEEFTAIINPPDSAILAVGGINEKVIKTTTGFGTTNVMKLTLSCDHRSIDGAVGASFLQTLKGFLENPVTMLV
jgi:pyruvate dehydrogenase E2 component (dihydrolipoamide acetyltransferase)